MTLVWLAVPDCPSPPMVLSVEDGEAGLVPLPDADAVAVEEDEADDDEPLDEGVGARFAEPPEPGSPKPVGGEMVSTCRR